MYGLTPLTVNGAIEVLFKASVGEAFVQALEIGENLRGNGATPISSSLKP